MLPLTALLILSGTVAPQETADLKPREEKRIERLEAALAADRPAEIVANLQGAPRVADARIMEAVKTGLRSPNLGVHSASVEALRFHPSGDALETLHDLYSRQKFLGEHPSLLAQLLRATGEHGDEGSLTLLVAGGFREDPDEVLRARVFAVGNVPGKQAVDVLIQGMNMTEPRQRLLHMDEFRLALAHQTGADWGMDHEAWTTWWNANRERAGAIAADAPLKSCLQREWDEYWSATSVLPLETPTAPPEKRMNPGARSQESEAVEANAKRAAEPAGDEPTPDKGAAKKEPYRRPGKAGTPPKGAPTPGKQAGKGARAGKGKKGAKGTPAPTESEAPDGAASGTKPVKGEQTPKPAGAVPQPTEGIRPPKWDSDEML